MSAIVTFLYFIVKVCASHDEVEMTEPNVNLIIIKCIYDSEIEITPNILKKYKIFNKILKYNRENSIFSENETKTYLYEMDILKKFINLNYKDSELVVTSGEFHHLLGVLDYFDIRDAYKYEIYKKISESAISSKIIDELFIQNEKTNEEESGIYIEGDVLFWHIFLNEVLRTFELGLEKSRTSLKITNIKTEYIPQEVKEIDEIILERFIFYMAKVDEDIDRFIKMLAGIFFGFLNIHPFNNKIKKITIDGKCSNQEFKYFTSIFAESFPNILKISFENFETECTLPEDFKTFLDNFPNLQSLEVNLSENFSEKTTKTLLEIDKVKSTITKITMEKGLQYQIAAVILMHNLPKLLEFELFNISHEYIMAEWSMCGRNIPDPYIYIKNLLESNNFESLKKLKIYKSDFEILSKILSNENIRKQLEVLIIDNNNIFIENAEIIAQLENLTQLTMNIVTFDDQRSLLKILESKVLKKSVKELTLFYIYFDHNSSFDYSKINPEIVRHISDFNCLHKLHLSIDTDHFVFKEILSSINLQKTITDLRIKQIPEEHYLEKISCFQKIEKLCVGPCLDNKTVKCLLNTPYLWDSARELNFYSEKLSFEMITGFSCFKSLRRLDLSQCNLTSNALNAILTYKNLQKTIEDLNLNYNDKISDCSFERLSKFKKLERLNLEGLEISKSSMTKLLKCENLYDTLKELNMRGTYVFFPKNYELLTKFKTLEILEIEYAYINPDTFLNLLKCENFRKSLRKLRLYRLKNLSQRHIDAISTFDHLKFLSILHSNNTKIDLTPIKESKKTKSTTIKSS